VIVSPAMSVPVRSSNGHRAIVVDKVEKPSQN
jgi:hypothetical protein